MATNRIDILDAALLRPGRIDRKIEFPHPTTQSRAEILRIHSRKMNLLRAINLTSIAEKLSNASGAECKVNTHRSFFFCLLRSEENTSELQSQMRISYAVFCSN